MSYTVGYRRPPAKSKFAAGASGNPKGRPKGSRNFLTLLEQELAQKVVVNENGRKKSVTRVQAMVKRLVTGALAGDQKSLLTLVDIMRRTGQMESADTRDLLPANHREALEAYVLSRQNRGANPTAI